MFKFIPLQVEWEDEVVDFLKEDKTIFTFWNDSEGYDGYLYCKDFVVSYDEYKNGIRLLLQNPEDGIEVETEIPDAIHAKKIYNKRGDSLYYFVYEDKEGNVIAYNENFEAFMLTAKETE